MFFYDFQQFSFYQMHYGVIHHSRYPKKHFKIIVKQMRKIFFKSHIWHPFVMVARWGTVGFLDFNINTGNCSLVALNERCKKKIFLMEKNVCLFFYNIFCGIFHIFGNLLVVFLVYSHHDKMLTHGSNER